MKIAYVINSVEGGGAALPVPAVTQVMRDRGHHVEIFALSRRDGRAIAPMEQAGLRVHVREGGKHDHLTALRWLDGATRAFAPDVIWTSLTRATLMGQIIGLRRHCPVISWQHSARLKPMNARLMRLMRHRTSLWIADSCCVEEQTRETLGIPPEQLTRWPIFRASPDFPMAKPWEVEQPIRIGTLGRLHPVKGYDILCAALALLCQSPGFPPFELLIAGAGEEQARLETLIARDNLPVRLVGYVSDTRTFLTSLNAYVQPSLWEGLCLAAHEAMLAGLPVIASEAGELPFTITPDTGWIVPPRDPQALAAALADLLAAPERLVFMGRQARRRVLDRFGAAQFDETGGAIVARVEQIVERHRRS
ncbi:glycosyltransferase [Acetobacter conturbans]|uniref:Glycosyltransferase n=1 Tax=Acetobacter conturbans TaxID=1737472 RepID=A0ABX0K1K8_9PROT|nr:glycosyltransferase [Acetobacter conturbans]NHN89579.1 glycosyltransferase [Acetobacter conturbans]